MKRLCSRRVGSCQTGFACCVLSSLPSQAQEDWSGDAFLHPLAMRPDFSQSLLPHSLGRHSYFFFPYCQHNGMFCFHDVLFVKITMLLKCQRILACSDLCRQSLGRGSWASGHNGSKGSHKTSLRGYLHCQNKKKIKS